MLVTDEAKQLIPWIALFDDSISNVGPIEARDESARLNEQPVGDFIARWNIGRRRQSNTRHGCKALAQYGELSVFGPEVVPPL